MRRLSVILIPLLATSLAQAQNWPGFRGPGARGIADGVNTPSVWNAHKGRTLPRFASWSSTPL